MKSGRVLLLGSSLSVIASVLFWFKKQKTTKEVIQPTIQQYLNRLNEFSISNFDNAVEEFNSFISMGFNPDDAFQLTIVKRVYI